MVDPWSITAYGATVESMFCFLFSRSVDLGPSGLHLPFILKVEQRETQTEVSPTKGPALPSTHWTLQKQLAKGRIQLSKESKQERVLLPQWSGPGDEAGSSVLRPTSVATRLPHK